MNERILYIPWPQAQTLSEHQECQQWVDVENAGGLHYKQNFRIVHGGSPLNMGWGDQLYIIGHGAPGDHEITSDGGASIKYDALCTQLKNDGLKWYNTGVIKYYS
jgi:hypothetical protein